MYKYTCFGTCLRDDGTVGAFEWQSYQQIHLIKYSLNMHT